MRRSQRVSILEYAFNASAKATNGHLPLWSAGNFSRHPELQFCPQANAVLSTERVPPSQLEHSSRLLFKNPHCSSFSASCLFSLLFGYCDVFYNSLLKKAGGYKGSEFLNLKTTLNFRSAISMTYSTILVLSELGHRGSPVLTPFFVPTELGGFRVESFCLVAHMGVCILTRVCLRVGSPRMIR